MKHAIHTNTAFIHTAEPDQTRIDEEDISTVQSTQWPKMNLFLIGS